MGFDFRMDMLLLDSHRERERERERERRETERERKRESFIRNCSITGSRP